MPRRADGVLLKDVGGRARMPGQAAVQERLAQREQAARDRQRHGFPRARRPEDAITPHCRCSDNGCGCPTPRTAKQAALKGDALGPRARHWSEVVVAGDALGPAARHWSEAVLTADQLGVRVRNWREASLDLAGLARPHARHKQEDRKPNFDDAQPYWYSAEPDDRGPCQENLWADLVEPGADGDPVDTSNWPSTYAEMPAVNRPWQLDFGDNGTMPFVFQRPSGDVRWFVANARFLYELGLTEARTKRLNFGFVDAQYRRRFEIPRCFGNFVINVVPQMCALGNDEDVLIFPAGEAAHLRLVTVRIPATGSVAEFVHQFPPSAALSFSRKDEDGTIHPRDIDRETDVTIVSHESLVFVSRGTAGVAVYQAFGDPSTAGGVRMDFQGHLRLPPFGGEGLGLARIQARHLKVLAVDDDSVHLLVGVGGMQVSPTLAGSDFPAVFLFSLANLSTLLSGLDTGHLPPPTAGISAPMWAATTAVVVLPLAPGPVAALVEDGSDLMVDAASAVQSLDALALDGAYLPDGAGRPLLALSRGAATWFVDLAPIVSQGNIPSVQVPLMGPLPWPVLDDALASFAVSGGPCLQEGDDPDNPNDNLPEVGPPKNAATTAAWTVLRQQGTTTTTLADSYATVGFANMPGDQNGLHLLALVWDASFSTLEVKRVGFAMPSLPAFASFECRSPLHFDRDTNTLLGTSRGRFGLITWRLPPADLVDPAIDEVTGEPDGFYPNPSAGALAPCSGGIVNWPLTARYPPVTRPSLEACLDPAPFAPQSPCSQSSLGAAFSGLNLPLNLAATLTAEGSKTDAAGAQPWLRIGFGYEFVGGEWAAAPAGTYPARHRQALFLADRGGGAVWAFNARDPGALATDAISGLSNASDVASTSFTYKHHESLIIATAPNVSLRFLRFDWTLGRFFDAGSLWLLTGAMAELPDREGEPVGSAIVTISRLTTLQLPAVPASGVEEYLVGSQLSGGRNLADPADLILLRVDTAAQALRGFAPGDYTDRLGPLASEPGWVWSWQEGRYSYQPVYESFVDPAAPPETWVGRSGGPLGLSRFSFGRATCLDRDDDVLQFTWLPGDSAGEPGRWRQGNASVRDVAAHGEFVFVLVEMIRGGSQADAAGDSSTSPEGVEFHPMYLVVLRTQPLGDMPDPVEGKFPSLDGPLIERREVTGSGAEPCDPKADQILWAATGPASALGLLPVAAVALAGDGPIGEIPNLAVDPNGRFVSCMNSGSTFWLVYLGIPGSEGYADAPRVVSALGSESSPSTSPLKAWNPVERTLSAPLSGPLLQGTRAMNAGYPLWPLVESNDPLPETGLSYTPGPLAGTRPIARPFHSSTFFQDGGELFLAINTVPPTAWWIRTADLPESPQALALASADTSNHPVQLVGALCSRGRGRHERHRVAVTTPDRVIFIGIDGAFAFPTCGPLVPSTCCVDPW